MKTLIAISGTTGIGKTRLAIDLAKHLGTEIISCDSRQFFKEMKIGTAMPSKEELEEVPHHFIGTLSVEDEYSIGQFEVDALRKLKELFGKHPTVIMAGGSMMYERAVLQGLNDLPEANKENQDQLEEIWKKDGLEKLKEILKTLDIEYFNEVDLENPRRLLRAIDVIWQTGEKYSELISKTNPKRDFEIFRIGINAPRDIVYQRINERVDLMITSGLLEEARQLYERKNKEQKKEYVPLKTVGYKELFNYFDGIWKLEFAVSEIKKNSRRFAKRQLTWYRGENDIHWVDYRNPLTESLSLLQYLNK